MNIEEFRNIFENENTHWWYRILDDLMEYFVHTKCHQQPLKILDAGCGTGRAMSRLLKFGEVTGIDASPVAIEFCKSRGLADVATADLNELSFEGKFDVIVSLDVLYHKSVKDIDRVISSFNKALFAHGVLILNLAAFTILRRAHDDVVGGNKRFRAGEIKKLLARNGFTVHTVSYRYPLLFTYILLRKIFGAGKGNDSDLAPLPPFLNSLLFLLHRIENEIIKMGFFIPFGSSLFVVATRKKEGPQAHDDCGAYACNTLGSKIKTYAQCNSLIQQAFRYSIVGIFNTVLGLSVIYLLFNVFHVSYIVSNICGYAAGLVNGFVWNKKWTFESSRRYYREISPYLIVFAISYAVNLVLVVLSVELVRIHPNVAQVIGITAYSVTNFLVNRCWTFSKKHEQGVREDDS